MVWLLGGGFFLGAGSRFLYSGKIPAQQCVVVVTLNYRFGALGLAAAAHPRGLGLSSDSRPAASS